MKQHKMKKKVCTNKVRDALTLKKCSINGLKWRGGGLKRKKMKRNVAQIISFKKWSEMARK